MEQNINAKSGQFWIGISNPDNKGLKWSDGSPVNFTNWDIYQPDYYNKVEEFIFSSGKWNDIIWNLGRGWVCFFKKFYIFNELYC